MPAPEDAREYVAVTPARRSRARACWVGVRRRGFWREGTSGKMKKPLESGWVVSMVGDGLDGV